MFSLQLITLTSLTLRLPKKDHKIFYLARMNPGDRFSLTYRHSVEKTLVEGVFQVSPLPSMLTVETRMTSVGTGLPNTFSQRTRREGQWIVVDEEHKEIDSFRFFISRINTPILTTPKEKLDLNILPSGTVILLGVEKISLIRYFLYQGAEIYKTKRAKK